MPCIPVFCTHHQSWQAGFDSRLSHIKDLKTVFAASSFVLGVARSVQLQGKDSRALPRSPKSIMSRKANLTELPLDSKNWTSAVVSSAFGIGTTVVLLLISGATPSVFPLDLVFFHFI